MTMQERAAELTVRALDESMRADFEFNTSAGSGTNTFDFERVAAGRKLVIEHLSAYDDTSSPTRIRLGYKSGGSYYWIKGVPAPLISETVEFTGRLTLREGMSPAVRFEGATSGDDIYATLNGYWIKA